MLTGSEIRKSFLDFFAKRNHQIIPSSSLVPDNDPTLMFTNSGMVQFKNNFMGLDNSLSRAVSSQRCVRAGGKHNDLDNVGYTARHHTFFEMLGNFSFGNYFKEEAITWAWEFLTKTLKIDPKRLCVTVYHTDDEAFDIWHKKIGVPKKDIIRIETSDNFWTMGDTGPCGPCSEIFYDHGEHVFGDRPGTPDEDGDRFVEIWNLVFTQFDLQADGSKVPLKQTNIDTGAGLERIIAVVQGVTSNYDTDIFQTIIQDAAHKAGVVYGENEETDTALRVVADHLRTMAFLMVDGVMPSNEGRGYVLRRIMRRAMRYVHMMGVSDPFIYKLVPTLVKVMGEAYPELVRGANMVADVIQLEETRFGKALTKGMAILEKEISHMKNGDTLSGDIAFKLYDTFGFPMDLTQDALRLRGISVDENRFNVCMEEQRARARAAHKGTGDVKLDAVWFKVQEKIQVATEFLGYSKLEAEAEILVVVKNSKVAESAQKDDEIYFVVNQTPFYAESGGQVGDTGAFVWDNGEGMVIDTQKVLGDMWIHRAKITKGTLNKGDYVQLKVDVNRRGMIARNHSVTHLLHKVLKELLGDHVVQRGSLVTPEKTRFDFSQPQALTVKEITEIEKCVNDRIWAQAPVIAKIMSKDEAITLGAEANFGEKYGDEVRVLTMGDSNNLFSLELCGGTHVNNTGEIGLFKIVSESSISAGIRRIEAVVHQYAYDLLAGYETQIKTIASNLSTKSSDVAQKVSELSDNYKKVKTDLKKLSKSGGEGSIVGDLAKQAEKVGGITFLAVELKNVAPNDMRELVTNLKQKLASAVVVLAGNNDKKSTVVVGVTSDLVTQFKASDIVNAAAKTLGGRGGGKPDLAMAGGAAGDIAAALAAAKQVVA